MAVAPVAIPFWGLFWQGRKEFVRIKPPHSPVGFSIVVSPTGEQGREHPADSSGKQGFAAQSGAESGAVDAREAMQDADLLTVVQAWPTLPDATRAAVLALVRANG